MRRSIVELAAPPSSMREGWDLQEETLPESVSHDEAVTLLKAILVAWAARRAHFVARNLAVRWEESRPSVGVDPDVSVFFPAPPDVHGLSSVRTWLPGHTPPVLAVEVVSEGSPRKDYALAPFKYAASGTRELWIFDPWLAGPSTHGGPFRIQVWRRSDDDRLERLYAGAGPAYSPELDAYLVAVDHGRKLRIATDALASRLWLTAEETHRDRVAKERAAAARVAKERDQERDRVAKERDQERDRVAKERARAEAALARVAELERALKAR